MLVSDMNCGQSLVMLITLWIFQTVCSLMHWFIHSLV